MSVLNRCKGKSLILILLFIFNICASFKMIYALSLLSGIETFIRLLIIIIIVLMFIGFSFTYLKYLVKRKSKYFKLIPITLIYTFILFTGSKYILKTYNTIDNLSSSSTIYSSSLISLVENKSYKLENIGNGKIGIISDYTSIDGNEIPKEVIEKENIKNKIVEYDDYLTLIDALYDKKIDYAFVPTSYVNNLKSIDEEKYESLDEDTKIIYTKEKIIKQEVNKKNIVKEPFSILIMGVDSDEESLKNSAFNGDALMLLTFNPNTLTTTILSIPRDSYVPISCFKDKAKNKITHAAIYGEDCMISTIEELVDIKIDYYVKINFKGVVNIIDALGGVEVDVPYSFCEQNSSRKWGKNTIYVEEGLQKLNGEQALALSRNRKNNTSKCSSKWTKGYRSDFVRGENQQLVLRATLNKLKEIKSLDTISDLLDKVSNSMETNMSTEQILSLYNIGKDILVKSSDAKLEDLVGFRRLHLSGYDARIYDERTGLNLYNYVLYDGSIKDVKKAMKINLNEEKATLIKEFSFDIDEDYKEVVIGKGEYETTKLPSFVGKTESEAKSLAKKLNLDVTIKYIEKDSGEDGTVLYQNYNKGTDLVSVTELILTVVKVDTNSNIEEDNNSNNKEIEEKVEESSDSKSENEDIDIDDITGIEGLE
ncbi:MAG: PASTA domain-containing protein [Lactobacillales bacterium]|nr:PASTA domain-containing protein [Lactobacillales bacterium]